MTEGGTDNVQEWFEELVDTAREGGSGHLRLGLDLTEPCQIEVFWMNNPLEGQVFIITHDRNRPDKQILVHGPFEGSSFVEEVEEIAKADRWQQPIPPPRNEKPGRGPPSRADLLADTISRFIGRLEQSIFSEFSPNTIFFGGRLWDNTFSRIYLGDVTEYDIEEIFGNSTKSDSDEQRGERNQETKQGSTETEPEAVTAGGGYIYDPVWIEKAPESTFSEKVWDKKPLRYDEIYTTEICGSEFHAYRDGLLLLCSEDEEEILTILNTIFAIGIFHRFRTWHPLLGREIYSTELRDGELMDSSYEQSTPTGRNQLVLPSDRPSDYDRSLLPIETLERLIEIVESIYPIHNVRNRAILHLRAHSHLLDDEFDASFVLNWTVIEQLMDDLLKDRIDEGHKLDWEDKELEFAEITNLISESEYELLDEHREKRNDIIHDMDSASVCEAEELDLLVSKLLVRNINDYLEDQDVQPINYRPDPVKPTNRKPEIWKELSDI